MGLWTPVPVACDAHEADVRPWSVQVPVNYLTVISEREGTRSPAMLEQLPGCAVFADLGTNAPIRGTYNCEGNLFAVSGQILFRISTTGVVTSLGTIPGSKRVTFAHNQVNAGNEVVIATGSSAYIWNTRTNTLSAITDDGFPGAKVVGFVDGYIPFVEPAGRYWGHSALGDATNYNTMDRSEAESQPDKIVGMGVSHREIAIFGERTTEFYRNVGDTEGAFERINGTEMERGCAATHSVLSLDNSLFWLGDDNCVYRLEGYQPVRISTQPIEEKIARCNKSAAFAFAYEQPGHKIYYLTFLDGQTWGYDVATQLWHRRKSYGMEFWRIATLTKWNGVWIGGDYANGKLYQLDKRLNNDAGQPLERIARFAIAHDNGNRVAIDAVRFWMNTGETQESPPLPQTLRSPLSISGDLGDGDVGDTETGTYSAIGGLAPYSFAITGGAFVDGLTMAADGSWSGTRGDPGAYTWTVTVTDAEGNTASLEDTSETSSSLAFEILSDAPILYWKHHETTGTVITDYSGNNRHGTVSGSPTLTNSGIQLTATNQGVLWGGSLSGSPLDVGTDDTWTIVAIVTRQGAGGAVQEVIAGQWRSPNLGYMNSMLGCGAGANVGKPQGYFSDSVSLHPVGAVGDTALTSGERTLLAVRRSPGSPGAITVNKNGADIKTTLTNLVGVASNGAAFVVGGTADGAYYPSSSGFIGKVEHVAVFDKSISEARLLVYAQQAGLA